MRTELYWLVTLMLALGCESTAEQPPAESGGSGAPDAGAGGSVPSTGGTGGGGTGGGEPSSGGAMAQPSGGALPTGGGGASGGSSTGGSANGGDTGSAGTSGTSPSGGSAGTASGGAPNGGTAGTASGGTGGASDCVKDLACKLAPPPSTGDIYQDCVNRINQFLTECACLPALERRTDGEACADQMAEYDAKKNTAHAGAKDKICQPGGAQNECPGYASNNQVISLCMQQMWDEGPPPVTPCTDSCYDQHGHFINMTDPTVTKVACGFYTTPEGKVWAVQNFSR
jgi:hypothetical protein